MNEQDVRTILDDLAHTPAPPSRVDVLGAVTTAQRRRRTRAVTSAAASVLVVGLAAGVTYAVIDRSPPAAGGDRTASVAAPVTSAPQQFDPLVQYASYGWLPEQETLDWRTTSTTAELLTLDASKYVPDPANGPGAAKPSAHVGLRLYPAGVVPLTDKPFEVQSGAGTETKHYGPVTAAPDVNGVSASWVSVPDDTETIILKWRYAPDGWAELFISRFSGDEREIAHRIASELRVGGTERIRFPFQLTGLPADLRPVASEVTEGGIGGPWNASLELRGQGPGLSVGVHPTVESDERDPNTTVDGHQARRETFQGDHLETPQYSDRLSVYDLDGLQAEIIIDTAPLGQDGVLGVFRALTVHPDRDNWTDQPLR